MSIADPIVGFVGSLVIRAEQERLPVLGTCRVIPVRTKDGRDLDLKIPHYITGDELQEFILDWCEKENLL